MIKIFFKIGELMKIKNDFRLEHNNSISGQESLSFREFCNVTYTAYSKYKDQLPRLDGNRIFYSLKHLNERERTKFD